MLESHVSGLMVKKEMTEEGEVSRYFYVDSQNIFEQQEYWFISINIADVIRKCTVLPLSNEAMKQHVFLVFSFHHSFEWSELVQDTVDIDDLMGTFLIVIHDFASSQHESRNIHSWGLWIA